MEKKRFTIFLENYELNKDQIERGPYIPQMDLAITCHELMGLEEKHMFTRRVTWELLKEWDLSPEALFRQAGEDARELLPPKVEPLWNIIKGQMEKTHVQHEYETLPEVIARTSIDFMKSMNVDESNVPPLYIISNPLILRGAGVVIYSDVLREFAEEINSDLVMLPSSIHEWFVIAKEKAGALEDLRSIVYDANHLVVFEHEILSFNVYCYSRKNDQIEIWEEDEV